MEQNSIPRAFLAFFLVATVTVVFPSTAPCQSLFIRGDCNTDGAINIADAILGLGILFSGAGPANCDDACDVNDDGNLDIGDPITLLANLFNSGPNPPPPNNCGDDPTVDSLDCLIGPTSCVPLVEDCSNGIDDDGDTFIDCDDSDCFGDPACFESDCDNGADDDNDGATDCADSDCIGDPFCAPPLSFEIDIYPIFEDQCIFCHGPPNPFGDLDMSGGAAAGYAAIVNVESDGCDNYDLISPGDSQASWIFRKIEGTQVAAATAVGCDLGDAGEQMPFGPFCCLDPSVIETIRNWIDAGANP